MWVLGVYCLFFFYWLSLLPGSLEGQREESCIHTHTHISVFFCISFPTNSCSPILIQHHKIYSGFLPFCVLISLCEKPGFHYPQCISLFAWHPAPSTHTPSPEPVPGWAHSSLPWVLWPKCRPWQKRRGMTFLRVSSDEIGRIQVGMALDFRVSSER